MRTIIVGAGTVGENIAKFLMREGHDVVVLDVRRSQLAEIEDELDVQTFVGNASDPAVLKEVFIHEADLLLAVTDRDETNLICAFTAKRLGCARVIARVRSRHYYDNEVVNYKHPLGIDMLISPQVSAAYEMAMFIMNPGSLAAATLAGGSVQLRTVRLAADSEHVGKTVQQLQIPQGALIGGIRRGDEVMIAHGNTILREEDRVTLIGLPDVLNKLTVSFDHQTLQEEQARIAIAGAGETGLFLAELLEKRGHRVTLIDRSLERARRASEVLARAKVLHGDATDIGFLREERVGKVDYYFATTGDDENNIMSSLLAKELGVKKAACLIDRPDYTRIVEKIGIDIAISPRLVVANKVLAMVKRGRIRSVVLLEEGEIEVYEYQALSKSRIVGQTLRDINMPKGSIIGAVVSAGRVTIPRGDYVIKPGSIVICVAKPVAAERLDDLFAETEAVQ